MAKIFVKNYILVYNSQQNIDAELNKNNENTGKDKYNVFIKI